MTIMKIKDYILWEIKAKEYIGKVSAESII